MPNGGKFTYDANKSVQNQETSGSSRCQVAPKPGLSRSDKITLKPSNANGYRKSLANNTKNARLLKKIISSYPQDIPSLAAKGSEA